MIFEGETIIDSQIDDGDPDRMISPALLDKAFAGARKIVAFTVMGQEVVSSKIHSALDQIAKATGQPLD